MALAFSNGSDTVYPRGYGEHEPLPEADDLEGGLSPWVRGTRFLFSSACRPGRFIPVGTGNAASYRQRSSNPAVYPREYGERSYLRYIYKRDHGLSPRVRGTPGTGG